MATLEDRLGELLLELGTDIKGIRGNLGNLGALHTAATNLVAAINEVKATADSAVAGTAPDGSTSVKGIVQLSDDSKALAMTAADVALTPHNLGAIVNVNNGLVKLDSGGKVAAAQLPGYVDDVLEFANFAALPGTGVAGVMYTTLDTNNVYRWGGSAYVEVAASPGSTSEVPEGTNLYYTAARADTRADGRITARIGDETTNLVTAYRTYRDS